MLVFCFVLFFGGGGRLWNFARVNQLKAASVGDCGRSSRNLESNSTDSNGTDGQPAQEVLERNSISNWARAQAPDRLEKILAAFYLYPKNLTETKLKINGPTSLAAQVIFGCKTLFLGYQAYRVAFQHLYRLSR